MFGIDPTSGKRPCKFEMIYRYRGLRSCLGLRVDKAARLSRPSRISALVIVVLGTFFVSCPSSNFSEKTQSKVSESGSQRLVQLTLEKGKVTPFNTLAELFDPSMPDDEYDELRHVFFEKVVRPRIGRGYSLSATEIEFMKDTERPRPGNSAFKTGLDFDEAKKLVALAVQQASFTVGSTKDDVLAIQGTPSSLGADEWWYGASVVRFQAGHVVGWESSPSSPLAVCMRPSNQQANINHPPFTTGATKSEVFAAQGAPTQFDESVWKYGTAAVYFVGGHVQRWKSSPETYLDAKPAR